MFYSVPTLLLLQPRFLFCYTSVLVLCTSAFTLSSLRTWHKKYLHAQFLCSYHSGTGRWNLSKLLLSQCSKAAFLTLGLYRRLRCITTTVRIHAFSAINEHYFACFKFTVSLTGQFFGQQIMVKLGQKLKCLVVLYTQWIVLIFFFCNFNLIEWRFISKMYLFVFLQKGITNIIYWV